ncbi:MAG: phenylalanine--tRNA ligase subunit beta [candidate division KSB1 bacterium]|nr:phenylalanine--tRNA ligase subunit beta [candidate division KSB1 bacterium]MDZ7365718.1 phenylalanine--tRNA ligase subunit beta [candidate division KSB1 bacterium]MDZ7403802.1 phenylalanine--tRNA ligase subunit beta [candidate division KSB1 bacterium]
MKFTYNWLKEYVDTPLSPQEIGAGLTMLGLELEGMSSTVPSLDGVVVGKVLSCEAHPQSTRLHVCQVNIGREELKVVCGAPNVAAGQLVAVAPPGTTLPDGMKIEARPIRGVESYGMICSEAELGLSEEAETILVLNGEAKPGQFLRDIVEQDFVFEINVTPNRPDCLGVIGVAREVGLLTGTPLQRRKIKLKESAAAIEKLAKVQIKDPIGCPRYAARLIQNLKIGASPQWLARRLRAVGSRSISNIVDVTNYVMLETGQPIHAFDFELLEKSKIVVQRAKNGEKFQTLDEKEHTLQDSDLLICDGERAVALAGVMGGLNSEVSSSTRHVLIECAYFDPLTVRRTAKRLGIASEAARRFERGTDPNGIPFVINRAAQLMQEVAGGDIAAGIIDAHPKPMTPVKIDFRPKRAYHVLGMQIPQKKMAAILSQLECKIVPKGTTWKVTAPTFRPDLTREIDLIEEVARVHGFNEVPAKTRFDIAFSNERNLQEEVHEKLRQAMTGLGADEAMTYSLLARQRAGKFLEGHRQILTLLYPLSEDLAVLRPYVIATLLNSLAYNLNRKNFDAWLFEIGSVFWRETEKPVCEERRLGAVFSGNSASPSWLGASRPLSVFDIRGFLAEMSQRLRLPELQFVPLQNHPFIKSGWQLRCNDQSLGVAGELSSDVLALYDIEMPVFAFELSIENLLALIDWQRVVKPVPRYPAIERDLAIITPRQVEAEKVLATIEKAGGEFLESVRLFDLYTGKQIPSDKKGMAFALIFRAADRNLRDEEVEAWHRQIVQKLEQEVGAQLRT